MFEHLGAIAPSHLQPVNDSAHEAVLSPLFMAKQGEGFSSFPDKGGLTIIIAELELRVILNPNSISVMSLPER